MNFIRPERANLIASALHIIGILGTVIFPPSAHRASNASALPCSCASFQTFSSRCNSPVSPSLDVCENRSVVAANIISTSDEITVDERSLTGASEFRRRRDYHLNVVGEKSRLHQNPQVGLRKG